LQQLIVKFVCVCNKLKKKNHLISFDYLFFDEPCKVFTGLFYVPVKYYRALPVKEKILLASLIHDMEEAIKNKKTDTVSVERKNSI
jgi:hypothetical protein